jgi:hypothetical protein
MLIEAINRISLQHHQGWRFINEARQSDNNKSFETPWATSDKTDQQSNNESEDYGLTDNSNQIAMI